MGAGERVFVLDDDDLIVDMLCRALRKEGYETRGAREVKGVLAKVRAFCPDLLLLDVHLPDGNGLNVLQEIRREGIEAEAIMLTADDSAARAVEAMKLGAADYLTKPFDVEEVKAVVAKVAETRRLRRELDYLKLVRQREGATGFMGRSPCIVELREEIEKLAAARVGTVLVTGESGTGKELVARYLHSLQYGEEDSAESPFIAVNCGALPETLIESELFGHERGAFTDAKTEKKGVFELAHGGSLLLDEIGEMPLNLQTKLLRVLEERAIRRVGGKRTIEVQATIAAATNRDLEETSDAGLFRKDLFYRLNAFAVRVPPLRERGEDILEIAEFYLHRFCQQYNKKEIEGFSPDARDALLAYPWPGNVRELKNVIERLVVVEAWDRGARRIEARRLPREIVQNHRSAAEPSRVGTVSPTGVIPMEELKRATILNALKAAGNNRAQAARLLKITYQTLRYQMRKYGLSGSTVVAAGCCTGYAAFASFMGPEGQSAVIALSSLLA